jgi:hypothetical protein
MFINLDGDAIRPPLEFETYPLAVAVEQQRSLSSSRPSVDEEEDDAYIFASLVRGADDAKEYGLEIQKSTGSGAASPKVWLQAHIGGEPPSGPYGIRAVVGSETTEFPGIINKLSRTRFSPFSTVATTPVSLSRADSRTALSLEQVRTEKELFDRNTDSQDEESLPEGWEARRNREEREFARRLAGVTTSMVVWTDDHVWWALRNPVLFQLESALNQAEPIGAQAILQVIDSIHGRRDARSELDFMTYNYIRQRAGVLLLATLFRVGTESNLDREDLLTLEATLVESELDPRVVLCLIPGLCNEIIVSRRGIWVFGGVKATVERCMAEREVDSQAKVGSLGPAVLTFLKRFLSAWRKKKGFGSVDNKDVFQTVDAALLLVVLELDQWSPPGSAKSGSVRQDLYEIVDSGIDCFGRATSLLESYHRLYVLSRLYQSRKMSADVLAVWKRILEGERDDGGGEFDNGEQRMREYLAKISNQSLVQDYGVWLANRNPKLGVQVFADETSRAPKFEASRVVALLRAEAPAAVKYYLEHLVFGKGHYDYVNDLVTYYLAVVIDDIESSESSRDAYRLSSETYRALHAPKPTFHHFLTANAPPDNEAWQSRLRLLQLLGGAQGYDASAVLARIAAVTDEILVPEIIILAGREGRHEDALRLLVHRLGDYDTAVSYCLRGGATIYGAVVPRLRGPTASAKPPPDFDAAACKRLFRALLGEFLAIKDPEARQIQTGMLLDRFGAWFDVDEVLALVPDDWRVESLGGFLIGALRRLMAERRETEVVTALRQAENVRVTADWLGRTEQAGATVELPDSGVGLND